MFVKLKYAKFKVKYVKVKLKHVKFNLKYIMFKLSFVIFKLKSIKIMFDLTLLSNKKIHRNLIIHLIKIQLL